MNKSPILKFKVQKLKGILILLFLAFTVFSKQAFPQQDFIGTITGFSSDNEVLISGEKEEKLEVGDVLVVQRNAEKIGLVRIIRNEKEGVAGEILTVEKGQKIEIGDMVGYQLLGVEVLKHPLGLPPLEVKKTKIQSEGEIEYKPDKLKKSIVDEAINEKLEVLEKEPQNRENLIELAEEYLKKGWYEHAIRTYKSAIELDTKSQENDKLLFKIAECYLNLGKYESAIAYFKFLKKYYPDSIYFNSADEKLRLLGVIEEKVLPIQQPLVELKKEEKKEEKKMEFERTDVKEIPTPEGVGLKRSKPKMMMMKINLEDEKKKIREELLNDLLASDEFSKLKKEQKESKLENEELKKEVQNLKTQLDEEQKKMTKKWEREDINISGKLMWHYLYLKDERFILDFPFPDKRDASFIGNDSVIRLNIKATPSNRFIGEFGITPYGGWSNVENRIYEAFGTYEKKKITFKFGRFKLPFGLGKRLIDLDYPSIRYSSDLLFSQGTGFGIEERNGNRFLSFAITGSNKYLELKTSGIPTYYGNSTGTINFYQIGREDKVDICGRFSFKWPESMEDKSLELGLSFTRKIIEETQPEIEDFGIFSAAAIDGQLKADKASILGEIVIGRIKWEYEPTTITTPGNDKIIYPRERNTMLRFGMLEMNYPLGEFMGHAGYRISKHEISYPMGELADYEYIINTDLKKLKLRQYKLGLSKIFNKNFELEVSWKGLKIDGGYVDNNIEATMTLNF